MNSKELIASGELELYIAGLLPEERNAELAQLISENDELKREVKMIEQVVMQLAKKSTTSDQHDFNYVLKKIITKRITTSTEKIKYSKQKDKKVRPLWHRSFIGWAAAAVFLTFFLYQYQQTTEIKTILSSNMAQKERLEQQIETQIKNASLKEDLLKTVASINTRKIDLAGQPIAPQSKVSVFWNIEKNKIIIDASQLPEPPEDMVYQIWSLKLDPLTPTSLGLLDNYNSKNNLFSFKNTNNSEAFGITLEPSGGSASPTLEQLYVLGSTTS